MSNKLRINRKPKKRKMTPAERRSLKEMAANQGMTNFAIMDIIKKGKMV